MPQLVSCCTLNPLFGCKGHSTSPVKNMFMCLLLVSLSLLLFGMNFVEIILGMMDSAYFVGRKELLDFFNELLDLNLSKIEETASGAIACQLTELIFPGSIQMSRINWGA
jgi:hypothetical protein